MKTMHKISDEQFERLNWYEQKYYRFCQNCGMYRDIRDNEVCNCENKVQLSSMYGKFGERKGGE